MGTRIDGSRDCLIAKSMKVGTLAFCDDLDVRCFRGGDVSVTCYLIPESMGSLSSSLKSVVELCTKYCKMSAGPVALDREEFALMLSRAIGFYSLGTPLTPVLAPAQQTFPYIPPIQANHYEIKSSFPSRRSLRASQAFQIRRHLHMHSSHLL